MNVLLAGLVVWLGQREWRGQESGAARAGSGNSERTGESHESTGTPVPPGETPRLHGGQDAHRYSAPAFRWTQLESSDYRTYIANLRGIGCPEPTIRDIITADVDEAFFAARRDQLKREKTAPALEADLQKLQQQEAALVASLLGEQPASSQIIAAESPRPPRIQVKSQEERDLARPISVPLVMQPLDSGAMKLTDAQTEVFNEVRQNFIEEIGGTNQDPNDPAYRMRWQAAQRKADDMLAGMLGRNFVNNYQQQVGNQ